MGGWSGTKGVKEGRRSGQEAKEGNDEAQTE